MFVHFYLCHYDGHINLKKNEKKKSVNNKYTAVHMLCLKKKVFFLWFMQD